MSQSLKENYEIRKAAQLKIRLGGVERRLLEEAQEAQLILEALNQKDLDKVSAIVKKLDAIKEKAKDLSVLTGAIDQAQAELGKYTGGGPIAAAWSKLKTKVGIDNPVVKVATFANALEQGFKQLPQILKNNGIDIKNLPDSGNVRLIDAVARQLDNKSKTQIDNKKPKKTPSLPKKMGESDPPTINTNDIEAMHKSDTSKEAAKRVKSVVDQIRKALAPAGIFGAFKKIPYVDGDALAQELAKAQVSTLVAISQTVSSGPQTAELANDMKDSIKAGGEAQTKATGPEQPAQPSGKTGTSEPAKTTTTSTNSAETGQTPPTGPGETRGGGAKQTKLEDGAVQNLANNIAKSTKIHPTAILKVLNALNDSGNLRESFKR